VSLLDYFERKGYRLLNQRTGVVFKFQDIIFEERVTHLATQPE